MNNFLKPIFTKIITGVKGVYFWEKLDKIFRFIYPLTWGVGGILYEQHMYKNKTRLKRIPEVFLKSFLVFSAKFMLRHGSEAFISLTNQVQDGILINLLEKEGACIGRFNKSEVYRRHIIAAYIWWTLNWTPE